eukprot:TRINITY_DN73210_c0_g1_i1.p1 TRINITY_DN73210_c0_g1~~TRINITY_DN73210_c0_g1_i1.p1  ORF type:complete len:468 (-),score=69.08 TRINITY_DN73210_c0_g1_i1:562-1914(-)
MGDDAASGGQESLSNAVKNNMDTLPKVQDALLQKLADAIPSGRVDVSGEALEQKGYFDMLSVIRKIPDEVLAVFRSNVASVVQGTMTEVRASGDDLCGNVRALQEFLPKASGRTCIEETIRSKFEACLVEAHAALSAYVEMVANGLQSVHISQRSFADVAGSVSQELQQILLAKLAVAMQECVTDVRRKIEHAPCSLDRPQNVPLAEMVPVDRVDLTGAVASFIGHVEKVKGSTPAREVVMETSPRLHSFIDVSSDRDASAALPRECEAQIRSTDRNSYVASPPPMLPDASVDAADGGGSVGHPEMCSRPCVFAAVGQCENGFSCPFCHLPHVKAVHLDKKRRDALKRMTYEERVATILPLVQMKLVEMQLDQHLLQDVADIIRTLQSSNFAGDVLQNQRKIQRTQLTKFTLRSMFVMMKDDGSQSEPPELRASVALLFSKIKAELVRAY